MSYGQHMTTDRHTMNMFDIMHLTQIRFGFKLQINTKVNQQHGEQFQTDDVRKRIQVQV